MPIHLSRVEFAGCFKGEIMESNTSFRFLRWLLLAIAVCVGGIQGLAQTKTAQSKPTTKEQVLKQHPPSKAWIKDPNTVMPMRQMTNAQRRAAAERSRTRRTKAEAQRKMNSKTSSSGVQQ
jgi:hypothetical protein